LTAPNLLADSERFLKHSFRSREVAFIFQDIGYVGECSGRVALISDGPEHLQRLFELFARTLQVAAILAYQGEVALDAGYAALIADRIKDAFSSKSEAAALFLCPEWNIELPSKCHARASSSFAPIAWLPVSALRAASMAPFKSLTACFAKAI
jgi:hypothetical protein